MLSDGGFHVLSVDYRGMLRAVYKDFSGSRRAFDGPHFGGSDTVPTFPYHQGTGTLQVSPQRRG